MEGDAANILPAGPVPEWALSMADHFATNKADPTKPITAGRGRQRTMNVVPQETYFGRLKAELLVRKEYPVVWDRIVADFLGASTPRSKGRGLCLYGQPGSAGWDVAFVAAQGRNPLLFSGGKVTWQRANYFELRPHSDPMLLVLHDVNGPAPIAPIIYNVTNAPYVVLASSPQHARYHSWEKVCGPQFACFRPFRAADPEYYEKDEAFWDFKTTFKHLGPSLRIVLQTNVLRSKRKGSDPRQDFELATEDLAVMVRSQDAKTWQLHLHEDLMGFDAPPEQPTRYHELFALKPKFPTKHIHFFWTKPRCEVVFANSFLRMMFFRNLKHANFMQHWEWATLWNPSTSARGAMFEPHSVRWLSWSPKPTEIVTVDGCHYPALPPTLSTALEPLSLQERPQENVLHVAPIGTTTIDALYEDGEKRLYLFQITLAHQHGVNKVGLKQALRAYKDYHLKEVVLVFVVQKEKRGKALASAVGRREGMKLKVNKKKFKVKFGYLVIGHDLLLTLEEKIAAAGQAAPYGYILTDSNTSGSSQADSSFTNTSFDTSVQIADDSTEPKSQPTHRTAAVSAPALSSKNNSQQHNGSEHQKQSRKRRKEVGDVEDGRLRSSHHKKTKIIIKESRSSET